MGFQRRTAALLFYSCGAMITAAQIFAATEQGLRIITDLYPQAADCIGTKKHFRIRDERTPSASLCRRESQSQGPLWYVTDFGGEGRGMNGIDLYMKHHGMDRSRFAEAILRLAATYGVTDEINPNVNRPAISTRPAKPDEEDGKRYFELSQDFTEAQLRILGPRVKADHAKELGWHVVKWVAYVKERKTTIKESTETYPIFARKCQKDADNHFFKFYEPLNFDKAFRFSYYPAGAKPKEYTNGLYELQRLYAAYNSAGEADAAESGKPYKEKKLPEAFICSGERDALCCKATGRPPIWFNSETHTPDAAEIAELMKYVEVLYNVPDLDETGRRKGRELALLHTDIHTIWLPEWLQTYKDNRGKPRKDLRDWQELRPSNKDFNNLQTAALPAKFWRRVQKKDGRDFYEIDTLCLHYFLALNGFAVLKDEDIKETQFIRTEGNRVRRVTVKDIKEFVRTWLQERYQPRDVINLVLNTTKLQAASLEAIEQAAPDFTSHTETSQTFYFENATAEVTAEGIKEYPAGQGRAGRYVWEDCIIKHRYRQHAPFFTAEETGPGRYAIKINSTASPFLCYLINSSRLYWRKEIEDAHPTGEEAEAYRAAHLFDIAGKGLTEGEKAEQMQALANKIFVAGYMLHRHKSPSRAWAPMAMDYKIGEENESNGRSGKSFFFKVISLLIRSVKLSGRNPRLMENPHVYDQVTRHTDMLLIDDCDRNTATGQFYDNITGDMVVNPKNNKSYTIPFEESPKFAFTTNFVPYEFDPSSSARLLYMVFSDYYHQQTETNDYRDTRSIRDDFGGDLYTQTYPDEMWEADMAFLMQCVQFYLQAAAKGEKPQPPMHNILQRRAKADMGANFEDWANGYFAPTGGNLNTMCDREQAFDDYRRQSGIGKITMQGFTRKLKAFAELCPWVAELNPPELRNAAGRIQKSWNEGGRKITRDFIYLKAAPGIDTAPPEEDDMPF